MLLAVDPGIRHCGCALFLCSSSLHAAALVVNPAKRGNKVAEAVSMANAVLRWAKKHSGTVEGVTQAAFEWPVVRSTQHQQDSEGNWRDPNDLLALPAVASAIAHGLDLKPGEVVTFLPEEWKGQLPKATMNDRAKSRLTDAERAHIVGAGSLTHNILDGIGIGLHALGRLDRVRIFPGAV